MERINGSLNRNKESNVITHEFKSCFKKLYNIHKLLSLLTKREKWEIRQINKLIESDMNKETSQQAPRRLRTL